MSTGSRALILPVGLAVAVSAGAAKRSPLVEQLAKEFEQQCFVTKIVVGNSWSYYNEHHRKQLRRLIDTEVSPDGGINYLVRAGHYENPANTRGDFLVASAELALESPLDRSFDIKPEKMGATLAVGSRVCVQRVEPKGDRLELWLQGPRNEYAKLKLMLGNRYESTSTVEAVMKVASRALKIDRYERLLTLEADLRDLRQKLPEAKAGYEAPDSSVRERLLRGRELEQTLQKLVATGTELASITGKPLVQVGDYSKQAAELEKALPELESAAKAERIDEMKRTLQANATEEAGAKAKITGKTATTLKEWQDKTATLDRYEKLLADRQGLYEELTSAGEAVTAQEQAAVKRDQEELKKLRATLERERQGLELADLERAYAQMEKRRVELLDAYSLAFGSPRQGAEADKLVSHLRQMLENRLAAQKKGSARAGAQAAGLQAEIEKTRRR